MADLERLEALSKTISNPYEPQYRVRWLAVTEYARRIRELDENENLDTLPEVIRLYGQHLKTRFLGVLTDPSECPELRQHILHLIVGNSLRAFSRIDEKVKNSAGSIKLPFNLGWPDLSATIKENFSFEPMFDAMIAVAENPEERDLMRSHAVISFHQAFKLAGKVLDQPGNNDNFSARFLHRAMQSSNPELRNHALTLGNP